MDRRSWLGSIIAGAAGLCGYRPEPPLFDTARFITDFDRTIQAIPSRTHSEDPCGSLQPGLGLEVVPITFSDVVVLTPFLDGEFDHLRGPHGG